MPYACMLTSVPQMLQYAVSAQCVGASYSINSTLPNPPPSCAIPPVLSWNQRCTTSRLYPNAPYLTLTKYYPSPLRVFSGLDPLRNVGGNIGIKAPPCGSICSHNRHRAFRGYQYEKGEREMVGGRAREGTLKVCVCFRTGGCLDTQVDNSNRHQQRPGSLFTVE